jgi:hypothetical protein
MAELTARVRLEAWKQATRDVQSLVYKRESTLASDHRWEVRVELMPGGPVGLVVVIAGAMQLEEACAAAIEGLTEYGVTVK